MLAIMLYSFVYNIPEAIYYIYTHVEGFVHRNEKCMTTDCFEHVQFAEVSYSFGKLTVYKQVNRIMIS